MSDETGYQGWTNYETWAVALWLDNDQGSYNYWHEQATDALRAALEAEDYGPTPDAEQRVTVRRVATSSIADSLKDEHESGADELLDLQDPSPTVFSDLLRAAVSAVDWYEVAQHYIDEHLDEVIAEYVGAMREAEAQ